MDPATPTKPSPATLVIGALLSTLFAGCGTPERGVPEAGAVPASGLLVRCGYRAGDDFRYLTLAEPVSSETGLATELRRLAGAASGDPAGGRGRGVPPEATRSYQVALPTPGNDGGVAHIELFEPGREGRFLISRKGSPPRPVEEPSEELLRRLRERSFLRLQADMLPPWHPLPWHDLALAGFLDAEVSLPARVPGDVIQSSSELPSTLLERLRSGERARQLAAALIEHIEAFSEEDLEPLQSSTEIGERLLALTRLAADGNNDALREITILSLEYLGEAQLFDSALRVLFPPSSNPLLHEKHPPGSPDGRQGFLREVRRQVDEATYGAETLWTLE